jgi:homospermidine synthase
MTTWPIHGRISGPIVMIGFGSIGRGTLPLIERHFEFDRDRFVVIDPVDTDRALLDERGIRFIQSAVTRDNYRDLLAPLLTAGGGQGFCVNLSVDVSSLAIIELCREIGALYIDTVMEPWLGFYFDKSAGPEERSNYALRETLLAARRNSPGGTTAVNCCGANPGMVSWFVKQALVDLAAELRIEVGEPTRREDWAALMQRVGVKGIHIAERDTQRATTPKPRKSSSTRGRSRVFVSEGLQPAELGWGTFEPWMPENGRTHAAGCGAAIYLLQPGANTRVRSWTPTAGPQYGFLVTHNESISIADYFSVRDEAAKVTFRPTCHYAYHPCDDAVLSLHEMFGQAGAMQPQWRILDETEIVDGIDELGVLLYGHGRNAYWYGSQLSVEETRRIAPYQNATGLQVTSAVLAGMVWALENPQAGIVEADEMDFAAASRFRCPISAPSSANTPTGRRSPAAPACFRRTSIRRSRGRSATRWCDNGPASGSRGSRRSLAARCGDWRRAVHKGRAAAHLNRSMRRVARLSRVGGRSRAHPDVHLDPR